MTLIRSIVVVLCLTLTSFLILESQASDNDGPSDWDYYDNKLAKSGPAASTKQKSLTTAADPFSHTEEGLNIPTFKLLNPSSSTKKRRAATSPEGAAREALKAEASTYNLDLSKVTLDHVHDTGFGPIIVIFKQEVNGLEVVNHRVKVTLSRPDLTPVLISGYLSPGKKSLNDQFDVSAIKATQIGVEHLLGLKVSDDQVSLESEKGNKLKFRVQQLSKAVRVERIAYYTGEQLVPAYYLEIYVDVSSSLRLYSLILSAVDGSLLSRRSLTHQAAAPFEYRVWADSTYPYQPFDGPQGTSYNPYPGPSTDRGIKYKFVSPNVVKLSSGPISTGDPWLEDGAFWTFGNNAEVFVKNPFGEPSRLGAPFRNRSLEYCIADPSADGTRDVNQFCGGATSVFFLVNWLHDWFYDAGFNEAAGNAQKKNYGRGGVDNDPIQAEILDRNGVDNAYMVTPKDGESPQMHVFLWSGVNVEDVEIFAPEEASLQAIGTRWGSRDINVTSEFVLVNDNIGLTSDACQAIKNNVKDKIAVIDLYGCNVSTKAQNALKAGARAILILTDQYPANEIANFEKHFLAPFEEDIGYMGLSVPSSSALRLLLSNGPVNGLFYRKLVQYDVSVDNTIIAHEWGHYLTNRLVSLVSPQARAMGEGWGDFVSLLVSVRADDINATWNANWTGSYAVFAYSVQGSKLNNTYYGARRRPYSTDFSRNPFTFRHTSAGVNLPDGITTNTSFNSQVHNAGEVWANVLWECYASLLRDTSGNSARLTFAEAQKRMKNYLVASLKMLPVSPTYLEARDAVLVAAALSDPVDYQRFCTAFAKRGMGLRATAARRYSTNFEGVQESYYCGPVLRVTNITLKDDVNSCDYDGFLDRNETGTLKFTIENYSLSNLTTRVNFVVSSSSRFLVFVNGNNGSIEFLNGMSKVELSFLVKCSEELPVGQIEETSLSVSFLNSGDMVAPIFVEYFKFNYNLAGSQSTKDELLRTERSSWSPTPKTSWELIQGSSLGFRGNVWHAKTVGFSDTELVSPELQVSNNNFTIQFDYSYDFLDVSGTPVDGGVVEISSFNEWIDLMNLTLSFPTLKRIFPEAGTDLSGRIAYSGVSKDFPSPMTETIFLGTRFAGKSVRIRFRTSSSDSGASAGWYISNLQFNGITNKPFDGITTQICSFTGTTSSPTTPVPVLSSSSVSFPTLFFTLLCLVAILLA